MGHNYIGHTCIGHNYECVRRCVRRARARAACRRASRRRHVTGARIGRLGGGLPAVGGIDRRRNSRQSGRRCTVLRRCADLRTPSTRPTNFKGDIDASEASVFRACRPRPSVLGRKGPSTRKRGERGRKSAQFRGTGHRTRGGTYKGKARWDAECREADFRPYSASCACGRLWPRTGRADRARERGVYSPKVDLKVWPVASARRRPATFPPSRVRCEVASPLGRTRRGRQFLLASTS